MWRRLHRLLAGTDGPRKTALPLSEFLHPVPLVALVVLAVNDHYIKGSTLLPQWVIGKLSDFAGLLFFPLLLTALGDTLLWAVTRVAGEAGRRIDFSLRMWKLVAAGLATTAVFAPLELSDAYGKFYVETLGKIGFPSATWKDPTDLLALVMIPVAVWLGAREIGRVPLGRLEVIERRGDDPVAALADVRRRARRPEDVDRLAAAIVAWRAAGGGADGKEAAEVSAALASLRS